MRWYLTIAVLALAGLLAGGFIFNAIMRHTSHCQIDERNYKLPIPKSRHEQLYVYGNENSEHLIIFIHGLCGDPYRTWLNSETGFHFPEELAKDLPNFFIVSFGYRSEASESPSIVSIAQSLKFEIEELQKQHSYRSVRIVAHSMGGLVAREYILRHAPRANPAPFVTHLILLGTPNTGSDLAKLGQLFAENRQLRELENIDTDINPYLEEINLEWSQIFKSTKRSRALLHFATYEELSLPVGKAVKLTSASLFADEYRGFDKDHLALAKPRNRDDQLYRQIQSWLQASLEDQLRQSFAAISPTTFNPFPIVGSP
jgi:pimeloyl-ACP methyl ester carboxylesterase